MSLRIKQFFLLSGTKASLREFLTGFQGFRKCFNSWNAEENLRIAFLYT